MSKSKKTLMIADELSIKVKQYGEQNRISQSDVHNKALAYFFKHKGRDFPELLDMFNEIVKVNLNETIEGIKTDQKSLRDEQKRIRFALNDIAKDSRMQNEFWNDYFAKRGNGNIVTSNVKKTIEYEQAESIVLHQLLNKQQNKHS